MGIGLCVIATGKYASFVPPLWDSARRLLLPGHQLRLFLFSDHPLRLPDCDLCPTAHRAWPGATLYRYHAMLAYRARLERMSHLFYIDADMRFHDLVGDEILGDLVATRHPGFHDAHPDACTFERNPASHAFVPRGSGVRYYAGGFQGGATEYYLDAMSVLSARIDGDDRRGVVAAWHDESHWNHYLVGRPPDVDLSPAYCYPEGRALPFEPKILALDKCHADLRG